jgi:hypothetical protein
MAIDLWSPARVFDGSWTARRNAEKALREEMDRRRAGLEALSRFERQRGNQFPAQRVQGR